MTHSYYINNYNGINTLYRIKGKIHGNASSLEAYYNGCWSNDSKLINSFMNKYVTGWLNEDDAQQIKLEWLDRSIKKEFIKENRTP